MRQLAMDFAQQIQPWLTRDQLQDLADALNKSPESQNCSIKPPEMHQQNQHRSAPNWNDLNIDNNTKYITYFVDYLHGNDKNKGSINFPLQNLATAVTKLRHYKSNRNRLKRIILRTGRHYLSNPIFLTPQDSNLLITNYNNEIVEISGAVPIHCNWTVYDGDIYQCKLTNSSFNNSINRINGIRINGERAIRARYPNNNPEINGFGSNLTAQQYLPKTEPVVPEIEYYPSTPYRNDSAGKYFHQYSLGIGGVCNRFDPPAGFWCGTHSDSLIYGMTSGLIYNENDLPNAPYKNTTDMIVHIWRKAHWSTWMLDEIEYNETLRQFLFNHGGFQTARGFPNAGEYYVENIFEELDYPTEWFFNRTTRILYYYNNKSNVSSPNELQFEATNLKVLFNLTGTIQNPIKNITIRGLTLRDTQITYMDQHGQPSGGDWALQRSAAIFIDDAEDVTVESNYFIRLDGNAISINRYCRNINILKNEIVWNGDNAISTWGDTVGVTFPNNMYDGKTTMGFDGTKGNQPRFITIYGNFVHELGIWEKQSSFYFQAKSCSNNISCNIFFNGPRAAINFNDGFGGNTTIKKNLLFSSCKESSDHGPFNSWDRQIYVTKVNNGTPSVIKAYDYITQNFMIANYGAIEAIDNDDGSSYYKSFNNFLVYGVNGMKSNQFGGHNNYHFNNIYGYINNMSQNDPTCFNTKRQNPQKPGYTDLFQNNTCILNSQQPKNYGLFICSSPKSVWPLLGNNTIYTLSGNQEATGLCNMSISEFQQTYQWDLGTKILGPVNDTLLLQKAYQLLWQ